MKRKERKIKLKYNSVAFPFFVSTYTQHSINIRVSVYKSIEIPQVSLGN